MDKFIVAGDAAIRLRIREPREDNTGVDAGMPYLENDSDFPYIHFAEGGDQLTADHDPDTPTLVLLHGYLESLEVWDDFIPLLRKDVRLIVPDLPGHGISQVVGVVHTMEFLADTVREAIVKSGSGKVFICGHSMGGYVACAFAVKYPELTRGLILMNSVPTADTEQKKEQRRRETEIVRAGKKELLFANADKSFAEVNRRRFAAFIEGLHDQISLTDDDGITALLAGMAAREDLSSRLATSNFPRLYIFGMLDEYISREKGLEVAQADPQAQSVFFENSGHMSFVEQSIEVADLVNDFLKRYI